MNKKAFASAVATVLKTQGMKKPISVPKQTFYITDNEGETKSISVKPRDKTAIYTVDDVCRIIDACVIVIEDAMKKGENITIHGFGTFGVKYRAPRITRLVNTDQDIEVAGRYVPKFNFGNDLRMCANAYGEFLEEEEAAKANEEVQEPIYDESDPDRIFRVYESNIH